MGCNKRITTPCPSVAFIWASSLWWLYDIYRPNSTCIYIYTPSTYMYVPQTKEWFISCMVSLKHCPSWRWAWRTFANCIVGCNRAILRSSDQNLKYAHVYRLENSYVNIDHRGEGPGQKCPRKIRFSKTAVVDRDLTHCFFLMCRELSHLTTEWMLFEWNLPHGSSMIFSYSSHSMQSLWHRATVHYLWRSTRRWCTQSHGISMWFTSHAHYGTEDTGTHTSKHPLDRLSSRFFKFEFPSI